LQRIGVRFAIVVQAPIVKKLRAVGVVEADPTNRTDVVLRFAGYVEKLFQGKIGDMVTKGTPLMQVYSPELTTAQNEFFLTHNDGATGFHKITLDRLRNLGLSEEDIAGIRATGKPAREVTITAPEDGTITEINVREGSSFGKNQTLYSIGDLRKNYIVARIFQRDLRTLTPGQSVQVAIPGSGLSPVEGQIDLIYPNFREGDGSAGVRITLKMPSTNFIPGLYVDLSFPIHYGIRLGIPSSAILNSGLHQYVFVDRGEGVLEPVEVQTGVSDDFMIEIVQGLTEGSRVAASGTFLLSSEAQLRSALPKWESKK
jgi:Cu(I)/Ag(I) efflux system membrane fusion protein